MAEGRMKMVVVDDHDHGVAIAVMIQMVAITVVG